jgi:peptidoglycan biosynthesis protein MviN/MurJ (putative lipid II flippase)
VVVIGAVLGPTFLSNAFLATNSVPSLTYSAIAGPVLALVVVPTVVRTVLECGQTACVAFLRRLSGMLITASAVVALVLLAVSPVLAWTLTAGIADATQRDRAQSTTVLLLVLVAPQVVLYTVAALGAAAQQARERFALAAAAPALENVGLIILMGAVAVLQPPGVDVDDAAVDVVLLLGAGATASVALHAGVQVLGAVRAGMPIRPTRGWHRDPMVWEVVGHLRRSVAVAALPAASMYLLLAVAATVRGGVLVFQTAYLVYGVPSALGARAITTAVLPRLSAAANANDQTRFAAVWRQALYYAVVAGLPSLCLLVAFARPVARTLSHGGSWTAELAAALALCIAVLGVAQLACGMYEIARQALFAHLDITGARLAGVSSFAVIMTGGTAALLLLSDGLPRLVGICAVVLVADIAAAAVVLHRIKRAISPEAAADWRLLRSAVLAGCAMVPVLGAGWFLTNEDVGRVRELGITISLGALATALFALALADLAARRKVVS